MSYDENDDRNGDAQSLINAANRFAGREPYTTSTGRFDVEDDLLTFVLEPGQTVHNLDLAPYLPHPARTTGTTLVDDDAAFTGYVGRYVDPNTTTLWGSYAAGTVTAVIDDSAQTVRTADGYDPQAGHGGHRAQLKLREGDDWAAWVKYDGVRLTQQQFAEFLDTWAENIIDPDPTLFLEVARTFSAKRELRFSSGQSLQNGTVQLSYVETIGQAEGATGDLRIPEQFTVALTPYDNGDSFPVQGKLRYRLNDGGFRIFYDLVRPDLIKRAAFDTIVTRIGQTLDLPVFSGSPRTPSPR